MRKGTSDLECAWRNARNAIRMGGGSGPSPPAPPGRPKGQKDSREGDSGEDATVLQASMLFDVLTADQVEGIFILKTHKHSHVSQ